MLDLAYNENRRIQLISEAFLLKGGHRKITHKEVPASYRHVAAISLALKQKQKNDIDYMGQIREFKG